MRVYRFSDCWLNTLERRVVRDGQYLVLTSRTFDVLQLLVERAGQIVTKDEMLGSVWNGSFVEEGNLPVHISKLRRVLEAKRSERFIETVHGTGYRFVYLVELSDDDEWRKNLGVSVYLQHGKPIGRPAIDLIAVLPRQNENVIRQIEYLADGFTASIINVLSNVPVP